jgi:hypothetical protein
MGNQTAWPTGQNFQGLPPCKKSKRKNVSGEKLPMWERETPNMAKRKSGKKKDNLGRKWRVL